MSHTRLSVALGAVTCLIALGASGVAPNAQTPAPAGQSRPVPIGLLAVALPTEPRVLDTAEQHKIRVTVVAKGLAGPFSLLPLPDGDFLVSERNVGSIRAIRKGVLDPQPLTGLPKVHGVFHSGLLDLALHPKFAENTLIYFTYSKPVEGGKQSVTLARGRYTGTGLADVKDLFVGDPTSISGGSRIVFGNDGLIYMTTGAASGPAQAKVAMTADNHSGKVLRLRDDGTPAPDNPFVGKPGMRPEIFTMGHRDLLALAAHPTSREVWVGELGPVNGDKIFIAKPGENHGWPVYGYGQQNDRSPMEHPYHEGIAQALITWQPGISPSGMMFYTGDKFPAWKGNLFVGGMRRGQISGTGSVERVVFNEKLWELRRESLLTELHQRIRDIRQGTDGLIYVLTDDAEGAVLKIEPAS